MPVILRLCVAIEKAALPPPPSSILMNPTSTVKRAAAGHAEPEAARRVAGSAEPTQPKAVEETTQTPTTTSTNSKTAARNAADTPNTTASPPHPQRRRHNLLHWFKRRGGKKAVADGAATTSAAPAQVPKPASHEAAAGAAADPDASHCSTLHPRHASDPPPLSTANFLPPPHPSTSPVAADNEGNTQADAEPQRSLMWVSVLLTPTTTVKSVVELVHSMVERRMGARLCEEGDVHNFSSTTTPAGSFAMVPSHAGTTDETGHRAGSNSGRGARGGGTTTLTPSPTVSAPTVQVVSPTSKTAPSPAAAAAAVDSTEWCLCVQDGDGVFHWMGSTRHYQKSAVLHAPFAAEACLQSHAAFEAERLKLKAEARARRKAQVRTSAGGSSRRASFATQGGPAALEGSDSASTAASTLGSDSSSRSSSAGEAEGDGAAGRGGRRGRRLPRPFHHRHTHITDGSGKAGRRDTKTNRKRRGGKAAELPDAPDTLRSSSATAKAFANPSADEAKFAFLKGVVVPSLVLQQRNPALARHRHRLPLYSEVHVPRAMRAEPLDPAPATPTMIKPSPTSETAEVPSAPAPALGSPSSVAAKASFDMPLVHTSFSKEEDVDVDVPPSVPAQTGSSASLASTPPTPAPQQAHAAADSLNATLPPTGVVDNGTDAAAAADAPRKSWTTWGESREDAEGREPTRAADGHTDAPVGLVPHATARGRRVSGPLGAVADEKATEGRPGDAADVEPKTAAEVPVQWTKEEDVARLGLAAAQRDYAAALAAYRAAVPPPPTSIHEHLDTAKGGADAASVNVDAELAALMKRKVELQAAVEAGRQAERQCERLTALVECMEKELREREERRALLTAR